MLLRQLPSALATTALAIGLAVASPAFAATLYVSTTGSDSTATGRYQVIQNINTPATYRAASVLVQPGDTIIFKPGVYTSQNLRTNGSERAVSITKSNITLRAQYLATEVSAASGLRSVIKPSQRFLWKVFVVDRQSYVQIRGFEVDGVGSGNGNVEDGAWPAGIEIYGDCHHITVSDNIVHDMDGAGMGTYNPQVGQTNPGGPGGSDYITLERNVIYNCCFWSKYETSAISLYGHTSLDDTPGFHSVIRGNRIFNNTAKYGLPSKAGNMVHTDGNAIILDLNGSNAAAMLIENNVVFNNGGRGLHAFKSSNAFFRNNTAISNCLDPDIRDGDLTAGFSRNVVFVNNIAVSDGNRVSATYNNTAGTIVWASNIYSNGTVATMGAGDVRVTNPSDLFVDFAGEDFRLRARSAAIDTASISLIRANPGSTPAISFPAFAPFDYFGRRRPVSAAPDKGAFEYIAVGRR